MDLVSHSGDCAEGHFAYTLNMSDIFSGWVERRCFLGKNHDAVQKAIADIRRELPFPLLGIDSDNGTEFINHDLFDYCQAEPKIQFTRGRPYKKDDNAHIEQKNWTHVRRLLGYCRYDSPMAAEAINSLERNELRCFQNFFQPSLKLLGKVRVGSRLKRRYDTPKTPFERVIESGCGDPEKLKALSRLRESLDPFVVSQTIDRKLKLLWGMRSKAPKPSWLLATNPARPWPFKDMWHLPGSSGPVERYRSLQAKETAMQTWS